MKKIIPSLLTLIIILSSCHLSQKLADTKPFLKGERHQITIGSPRLKAKADRDKQNKTGAPEFDNRKK